MSRPEGRLRIVVGGMVGAVPGHGGATWAVLQYALGLRRLGHEVLVVESVPSAALGPAGGPVEGSVNAAYAARAMAGVGLDDAWSMLLEDATAAAGRSLAEVLAFADGADLIVNLAGSLRHDEILDRVPVRLFVDLDPGFTQVWHEHYGVDLGLDRHTHFATYGRRLAAGGRLVPSCGRAWTPTTPPVVLEHWPVAEGGDDAAWTTVANWRSYGTVEHDGRQLGQKAHSWRALAALPTLVDERLSAALAIDPGDDADRRALEGAGWVLLDPGAVSATPEDYRRFVRSSKAELAVAKSGYVAPATGWFSDRSACYLASGRPVVAQDTGFSDHLPTGAGLLVFGDVQEAAEAVAAVAGDYERHRRAARQVAVDAFDSDRVLGTLLDAVAAA